MFDLTKHARARMAQRAIRPEAIHAALAWGLEYRRRGRRTVMFLGRRQVLAAARDGVDIRAYENVAIVLAEEVTLVTAVKTRSTRRLNRRFRH